MACALRDVSGKPGSGGRFQPAALVCDPLPVGLLGRAQGNPRQALMRPGSWRATVSEPHRSSGRNRLFRPAEYPTVPVLTSRPRRPPVTKLSIKHIKDTYLKRVDAPVGVKPALKCWMEINEG